MKSQAKTEGEVGAGRLSIVATPIGNLEDITLRALRTLKEADLILAEDTRRTVKLCKHYGIETRLRPFHEHSSAHAIARCVQELVEGQHLALVSDAGTPLISDPGATLVQQASQQGVIVESIPGPSALTAALTAAAIAFESLWFIGFMPRGGKSRQQVMDKIAEEPSMAIFFESPKRLGRTLADLAEKVDASRPVAVCRELTKLHEEVSRGSAAELAEKFREGTLGEVTVVIGGGHPKSDTPSEADIDRRIAAYLDQGTSARDITKELCQQTSLSRRALYARVIALSTDRK